jgi:LAO/AO transport system kinase
MSDFSETSQMIQDMLSGDRAALGRAITLVESNHPKHQQAAEAILAAALATNKEAVRVGITGVPGVGKSTFIEALGRFLIRKKHRVAVLAVDPSSGRSQGSILGDKTRMQELSRDEQAFIRPSPSGDTLGGVARKTRESILLCEAAGYDIILVETMGVGQSEILVHSMVDFFLLLKLAGAGDELQGIKRGIMEMADSIVINKADGANKNAAELAQKEFKGALHYLQQRPDGWNPEVLMASGLHAEGIGPVWEVIERYFEKGKASGRFAQTRKRQEEEWFHQALQDQLESVFKQLPGMSDALEAQFKQIEHRETTPFRAANNLVKAFLNKTQS